MIWTTTILLLLISLPVLFIFQYLWLSRLFHFNEALSRLHEIRHDAIMRLSDDIINEKLSAEERKEYRHIISAVDAAISNSDTLRQQLFRYKVFKQLIKTNHAISAYKKVEEDSRHGFSHVSASIC